MISAVLRQKSALRSHLPAHEDDRRRAYDYLVHAKGIRKSSWNRWGLFLPLAEFLHEYRVVQSRIDDFQVAVVPNRRFHQGIEQSIVDKIQLVFPGPRVEVLVNERIDREPSGKLKGFKTLVRD
jgi:hypothetical protein